MHGTDLWGVGIPLEFLSWGIVASKIHNGSAEIFFSFSVELSRFPTFSVLGNRSAASFPLPYSSLPNRGLLVAHLRFHESAPVKLWRPLFFSIKSFLSGSYIALCLLENTLGGRCGNFMDIAKSLHIYCCMDAMNEEESSKLDLRGVFLWSGGGTKRSVIGIMGWPKEGVCKTWKVYGICIWCDPYHATPWRFFSILWYAENVMRVEQRFIWSLSLYLCRFLILHVVNVSSSDMKFYRCYQVPGFFFGG